MEIKESAKYLIADLEKHLKEEFGVKESTINLKLDKEMDNMILIAKKTYAYTSKGELAARGIDFLKSDCIPYAARIQKEFLKEILINGRKDVQQMIGAYKAAYDATKVDASNLADFTIHERVTKHPSQYKAASLSVTIAKKMIDDGKAFWSGIHVPIVITKFDGKVLQGCHPDDFKGDIDKEYIWSHQILPKLTRIACILDPEGDWYQFDDKIVERKKVLKAKFNEMVFDNDKVETINQKINENKWLSREEKKQLLKQVESKKMKKLF